MPIFAQAKVEYTAQLIDILYPQDMFDGVKSIYDESKLLYRSRNKTPVLLIFRELLEKDLEGTMKLLRVNVVVLQIIVIVIILMI